MLWCLDAMKCFPEIHRGRQRKVMINELIGKVETLKSPSVRQSTIHMFFLRNEVQAITIKL